MQRAKLFAVSGKVALVVLAVVAGREHGIALVERPELPGQPDLELLGRVACKRFEVCSAKEHGEHLRLAR